MKSPFSGFSLFIHLAIIAGAMLFVLILGEKRWDAFKSTFTANGGSIVHRFVLQSLSVVIIVLLGLFMIAATSLAIRTGVREGAREPQVIFVKKAAHDFMTGAFETWTFVRSNFDADSLPDFFVQTTTYVRADSPY